MNGSAGSACGRTCELELRALRLQLSNRTGAAAPRKRRTAPHRGGGQAREARALLLVVEHAIYLERGVSREMATLVHEHLELEHGRVHLGFRRHGDRSARGAANLSRARGGVVYAALRALPRGHPPARPRTC